MAVKALIRTSTRKQRVPTLWVFSDVKRLAEPWRVAESLAMGEAIIVRHTDRIVAADWAARTRRACRRGAMVLISSDWRTAVALGLGGVHIPESENRFIAPGLRLWRKNRGAVLTTSAHSLRALQQTRQMNPDLVFLSPVFPTRSHEDRPSLGSTTFARWSRLSTAPVAALGGVRQQNFFALKGTRLAGVGGVGFGD